MPDDQTVDEIKGFIALSRKRPLNFALCYGKKPEGMTILFHRKKDPTILARLAKKEGETNKIAYGTFSTKGKVASLELHDDPPPGLVRQGKQYFSSIGMGLKLQLLSQNGDILEADEDIGTDDVADDDQLDTDDDDHENVDTNDSEDGVKWEAAKAKVEPLVSDALSSNHPDESKLRAAWQIAVERADGGDFIAALKVVAKIVPLLSAQAKPSDNADTDAWARIANSIEPQVLAALKNNHPEAGKIRAVWGFAQEKAAGDMKAAVKAVQRLKVLLETDAKEVSAEEPPRNVVAFQRSRIMWLDAKRAMRNGLEKFRSAVAQQSNDDEDQKDITEVVDALVTEFDAFDTQLEDILDQITQTPEGPERSKLKAQAARTIGTYLTVLDKPFFQVVDKNPFVAVNVAGRGKSSLAVVQSTLA